MTRYQSGRGHWSRSLILTAVVAASVGAVKHLSLGSCCISRRCRFRPLRQRIEKSEVDRLLPPDDFDDAAGEFEKLEHVRPEIIQMKLVSVGAESAVVLKRMQEGSVLGLCAYNPCLVSRNVFGDELDSVIAPSHGNGNAGDFQFNVVAKLHIQSLVPFKIECDF